MWIVKLNLPLNKKKKKNNWNYLVEANKSKFHFSHLIALQKRINCNLNPLSYGVFGISLPKLWDMVYMSFLFVSPSLMYHINNIMTHQVKKFILYCSHLQWIKHLLSYRCSHLFLSTHLLLRAQKQNIIIVVPSKTSLIVAYFPLLMIRVHTWFLNKFSTVNGNALSIDDKKSIAQKLHNNHKQNHCH